MDSPDWKSRIWLSGGHRGLQSGESAERGDRPEGYARVAQTIFAKDEKTIETIMPATRPSMNRPQVSVIIPARNEEASLGSCLESLVSQAAIDFEIIVVDDHSTDRTREIAESFPKVRVIEADPPPPGWTGKNNAVTTGAREARGEWLLFTDADTVHTPGSLGQAVAEAKDNKADVLSYSPEQIAVTFWEMAVLPVVFAELARQYPPSKVSDQNSPEAAANGQYMLIRREVYDAIGGHAAVASEILEDVALARLVKASGRNLRFRYSESVRTRMYRNFAQLREGWTKNLALLFPNSRPAGGRGCLRLGGHVDLFCFPRARFGRWSFQRYEAFAIGLFGLTLLAT